MKMDAKQAITVLLTVLFLTSCSVNPFQRNNHLTGSGAATAAGAGVGAGGMALMSSSKSLITLGGLGGGAVGYYVTSLRFAAGGLMQYGGQVYQVGEYAGIYLPSDQLFYPNTTEFRPQATTILNSAVAVIQRFPNQNILISGNTSGFGRPGWEQRLSQRRAQKVAAYFWQHGGIGEFKSASMNTRKLQYVGYGNYFPIANDLSNDSNRMNSRIQITIYPCDADLREMQGHKAVFKNVGALNDDDVMKDAPSDDCTRFRSGC